jgi:hypothetical protein
MQSLNDEDLDVKWVGSSSGQAVFLTNTREDMALKVVVKSLRKATAKPGSKNTDANFKAMTTLEVHTVVIQPGAKVNFNFRRADGFDVDATPVTSTPEEEQGSIQKIKHLIKEYYIDPNKKGELRLTAIGVRG